MEITCYILVRIIITVKNRQGILSRPSRISKDWSSVCGIFSFKL